MNPLNQKILDRLPKEKKETTPGKGCICGAWGEGECGCDVDWTDWSIYNKARQEDRQAIAGIEFEVDWEKIIMIKDEAYKDWTRTQRGAILSHKEFINQRLAKSINEIVRVKEKK